MKIGIQTWGSDGDILPHLALAGGLRASGHDVTLVYTSVDNKDYSELCTKMDFTGIKVFDHFPFDDALQEKLKRFFLKEKFPLKHLQVIFEDFYKPAVDEMWEASLELCEQNDLVIGHWGLHTLQSGAEKTGTPHMAVVLNHSPIPSRNITPMGTPPLGEWLNPLWWKIVSLIVDRCLLPYYKPLREKVGMPPYRSVFHHAWRAENLNLIAVSPELCQRPPDWPESYKVCGFFNLPVDLVDWTMPDTLRDFLAAGDPPVYMTYGSMTSLSEEYEGIALEDFTMAAQLAGCRALIQSRVAPEGVHKDNPNIYIVNRLPHQHIFPYCAAVVHHGGAGHTQSTLLSGCPSIVVAHIADQIFWGRELYRLGVAPRPIFRQGFKIEKLVKAIRTVLDNPVMKKKAAEIGARMEKENGVEKAVQEINQWRQT
ncbi:MAG: glycosyltransferase [Thermodesulfobacteriota bacterium]